MPATTVKSAEHLEGLSHGKDIYAMVTSPEDDYWVPIDRGIASELIRATTTFGHHLIADVQRDRVTVWVSEDTVEDSDRIGIHSLV